MTTTEQEEFKEQIEFIITDITDLLNANHKYQSIYSQIKDSIDLRIEGFTNEDLNDLANSIESQISYFILDWYETNKENN